MSGNAAIDLKDVSGKDMIFFGQNDGVPSTFVFKGITAGVVQLSLTGGAGSSRKVSVAGTHAKPKPKAPVRRLWGAGKGKFTTSGKYASAPCEAYLPLVVNLPFPAPHSRRTGAFGFGFAGFRRPRPCATTPRHRSTTAGRRRP